MYVLTVDQINSRLLPDKVDEIIAQTVRWHDAGVLLGPHRTAGDEFQMVLDDAQDVVSAILSLTRSQDWSVGLGIGPVDLPLPSSTRSARGEAFAAARLAIEAAKQSASRFAACGAARDQVQDFTALVNLLLELRARRNEESWGVADLLMDGLPLSRIAERLGVTPLAVSRRSKEGSVHLERAAVPALVRLLRAVPQDVEVRLTDER